VSGDFRPRPQVGVDHYGAPGYNTKERACSFWHQVDEVRGLGARTVLEVGPGNGIVSDWLRRVGVEVTTLDMDPALEPDVQGSVTELPFADNAFDAALCSQVLEHMPFSAAERGLRELARVARSGIVLSVPDATPWAGVRRPLYFGGWYIEEVRRRIPQTRFGLLRALVRREFRLRDWLFCRVVPAAWSLGGPAVELRRPPVPSGPWTPEGGSEHFWEVGSDGHPLERLSAAVERAGLALVHTYRVPENPWHRFVVARPRG
jgi:SAM-dependent methyltransferase